MNGISNLTKEECQQLVSSAHKVFEWLQAVKPEFSMFAVIMGIRDFLQYEVSNNKEKEVTYFMTAEQSLGEAQKEMETRF